MINKKIIALIATVTVMSIGGMAYAELGSDISEVSEDERAWVKNMVNHGNDPTQKIGYDCAHGHMSFGC